MIRKVLTSGQTGVELAALDTAIKLSIPHGGWTPLGKRNAMGSLPSVYQLQETATIGFQEALDKNTAEADGTLVVSRNQATPWTRKVVQAALKHQRQFLHVDLGQYPLFEAASLIASWLSQQHIKTVFVTGLQDSEDINIYTQTRKVLETAVYLGLVKSGMHPEHPAKHVIPAENGPTKQPLTVDDAVAHLAAAMPLKDRTTLANMTSDALDGLHSGLAAYIKEQFGLYSGNASLLRSCAERGNLQDPLPDEACAVILRALWEHLRRTHRLRVVK
ncbi:putative molybdenum carrier protein [Desulfatitalea alkaliphila]|uniref:Molybdenum carrier protein n=1 Tax=Desulfatitalea alkaliphila TaxID=2929485 RepID=A0AA41R2Z7_9BACT|nr:putative molybdenum carrier protein [Desulfatitalea alkaliphila]MCJ8501097.1 putative molybdenum carrier protein [Desulfatitalea alkaliphila]